MNMNEKRTAKLLSAVAVLAMVVCAIAIAVPASDAEGSGAEAIEIADAAGFKDALNAGGNYVVTTDLKIDGLNGVRTLTVGGATFPAVLENTTIDLGKHTVTINAGTLVVSNVTFTLSNGSLIYNSPGSALSAADGGNLVLNGITMSVPASAIYPYGSASSVTLDKCDITAGVYAVATNNSATGENKLSITITDSTLRTNSTDKDNATVLINAKNVELSINGGDLQGDRQVLVVRSGTAQVTGATLHYTNACSDDTDNAGKYTNKSLAWADGNRVAKAAVVVGDYNNKAYGGDAKLTMDGCTIDAESGYALYVSKETGQEENTLPELVFVNNKTTLAFGENMVKICGVTVTEDMTISMGSVKISGKIVANESATITATGDVKIDGTVTEGSLTIDTDGEGTTVTVPSGSSLELGENATLNIEKGAKLVFEDGATLVADPTAKVVFPEDFTVEIPGADVKFINGVVTATVTTADAFNRIVNTQYKGDDKAFIDAMGIKKVVLGDDINLEVGTKIRPNCPSISMGRL